MGHKVHPIGFRLGVVKGWQSRWYAEREYKDVLAEDILIRKIIHKELANASVSRIEIERAAANQVWVAIHTARPGIVIGKSGEKVEKLKSLLEARTKKRVRLEIKEIRQPELDAYLVGRAIAEQLEKRVAFRRAIKQAVQKTMRANAKGIRVVIGGRLGGAEIARSEKEVEGKIPLHTLRADIDFGTVEAHTTFGVIGIKVWIYKGDILPDKRRELGEVQQEVPQPAFTPREGGERRGPGGDRRRSGDGAGARGGERGSRTQGERPPRQQGERGSRAQGDRPARPAGEGTGERPPRPAGERGPRPPRAQGERPPRQQGERGSRPQGERPARPAGEGQQGENATRSAGERPPRAPRAQGERPPRQQGERAPRQTVEQVPEASTPVEATPPPPSEPTTESTQSE